MSNPQQPAAHEPLVTLSTILIDAIIGIGAAAGDKNWAAARDGLKGKSEEDLQLLYVKTKFA